MPLQRALSVLAAAGIVVAAAGCSHVTPLGPGPAPVSLPPARDLGAPITMQIMRSQLPAPTGECPTGSITLFGSEPNVPRTAVVSRGVHFRRIKGSTPIPVHTAIPVPTTGPVPTTPPAPGVACYRPVGTALTISSAAVSSVTTNRNQPAPAWYIFVVAFPAADVPALTTLIRQAYDSGDALGMSVAGKLWQAPQIRQRFIALRAEQINLSSRKQAFQLYRLLVPANR
jgi:hypothetical protein